MPSDGRGSVHQRHLFELAQEIFPDSTVVYEQLIEPINQRYDIFILELGIAIEYDGIQHSSYSSFFHKDESDFILQQVLDRKKNAFSENNGIKLLRLEGDVSRITSEKLGRLINDVDVPIPGYNSKCLKLKETVSEKSDRIRHKGYKDKVKLAAKNIRQAKYKAFKEKKIKEKVEKEGYYSP